jgi:SPP1 family predicted phage head-tail adaptor
VGALRRRVALETPDDVADEIGGVTRGWRVVATVWAQIETPRGATRLQGERLEQVLSHRVTLRWRAGVTGEMRLRLGARVFAIRAVRDPDERRRRLELDCEETTP